MVIENEQDLCLLIELSLIYLYRFVDIAIPSNKGDDYKLRSEGATSVVYLCESGKTICKIPKNLIAADLLIKQEYDNYLYLCTTPLKGYIATEYRYDPVNNSLYHRNIVGHTGESMLFQHKLFSPKQMNSLESFYKIYCACSDKELILDIHPGNFIWDEMKKCWCLIDIGSIPQIGSEYYAFEDFPSYFKFIWQDREILMRNIPIRSVDLYLPPKHPLVP